MQYQVTPEKWQKIKDDPAIVEAIERGAAIVEIGNDAVEVSCNSSMTNCDCWQCTLIGRVWDLVFEVIQEES